VVGRGHIVADGFRGINGRRKIAPAFSIFPRSEKGGVDGKFEVLGSKVIGEAASLGKVFDD